MKYKLIICGLTMEQALAIKEGMQRKDKYPVYIARED